MLSEPSGYESSTVNLVLNPVIDETEAATVCWGFQIVNVWLHSLRLCCLRWLRSRLTLQAWTQPLAPISVKLLTTHFACTAAPSDFDPPIPITRCPVGSHETISRTTTLMIQRGLVFIFAWFVLGSTSKWIQLLKCASCTWRTQIWRDCA